MSRRASIALAVAALAGAFLLYLVLFARTDVETFRARAENMAPTIEPGDRVAANTEAYDGADPRPGDVVAFHPPEGAVAGRCGRPAAADRLCPRPWGDAADVTFVSRVVAVEGDRLRVEDGRTIRDGERAREPWAELSACAADLCTFRGEITIPPGHVFVMGDNRGASDDSRFWGPVPRDQIVGRVDRCAPFGLWCTERDDG